LKLVPTTDIALLSHVETVENPSTGLKPVGLDIGRRQRRVETVENPSTGLKLTHGSRVLSGLVETVENPSTGLKLVDPRPDALDGLSQR